MAEPVAHAVLPAEIAARLTEFARSCRAAARAVSLYPAAHPSIGATLARLAQSTGALTASGPFTIQVQAGQLLAGGARLEKPDRAVPEVAALLHRHLIGAITLNAGADADSWRTLLLLLARTPEEIRIDGGIAHLWATAGGPSIEIQEIDYAEVLREKEGLGSALDSAIADALAGTRIALDDAGFRALLETIDAPEQLEQIVRTLEERAQAEGLSVDARTAALLALVRGLVDFVSATDPDRLPAVLSRLADGVRHVSAEEMLALLAERARPEAAAGGLNVAGTLIENMSDASVAGFVAGSVVAERGATERLAHAFRSLVPELDRQRQLLALARGEVAATALGEDPAAFQELWQKVEGMLTSYDDTRYVSSEYARELSHARTQPIDVERTSDDPPERLAAWLATVSDAALRNLDADLLSDLLTIETDPLRWRDVADTVAGHAADLVRVGYFDQAWTLAEQIIDQAARDPDRQPHAARALERFGRTAQTKHVPAYLRTAGEPEYERFRRLCHAIGGAAILPLVESLAAEQDARARRRLREILAGFGPRGADAVRALMTADSWEVRRTAASLLREYGGGAGLKELVPLLSDAEPLVRREAIHGLILSGTPDASALLARAVLDARGRERRALGEELAALRDDRAAVPFFAYLVRTLDPWQAGPLHGLAVEALGGSDANEAVDALVAALHKGRWWTPFSTRRWRTAAVQALGRMKTPAAADALRRVASGGPLGARAAARAVVRRIG